MADRKFFVLIINSQETKFQTISDYQMKGFDLMQLWHGDKLDGALPAAVKLFVDSTEPIADYLPNPISWPIVSDRLLGMLAPFINENHIQLIPAPVFDIKTKEKVAGYTIFNVTHKLPALDLEQSRVTYSPYDPTKITYVTDYVFSTAKIPDSTHIFRLQQPSQDIVFSEEVVSALTGKGLNSIAFIRSK
jgi:hypothetical protein